MNEKLSKTKVQLGKEQEKQFSGEMNARERSGNKWRNDEARKNDRSQRKCIPMNGRVGNDACERASMSETSCRRIVQFIWVGPATT